MQIREHRFDSGTRLQKSLLKSRGCSAKADKFRWLVRRCAYNVNFGVHISTQQLSCTGSAKWAHLRDAPANFPNPVSLQVCFFNQVLTSCFHRIRLVGCYLGFSIPRNHRSSFVACVAGNLPIIETHLHQLRYTTMPHIMRCVGCGNIGSLTHSFESVVHSVKERLKNLAC